MQEEDGLINKPFHDVKLLWIILRVNVTMTHFKADVVNLLTHSYCLMHPFITKQSHTIKFMMYGAMKGMR